MGWHPSDMNEMDSDEQKKVDSFFPKERVTPSVAAPDDTNPSDATGHINISLQVSILI